MNNRIFHTLPRACNWDILWHGFMSMPVFWVAMFLRIFVCKRIGTMQKFFLSCPFISRSTAKNLRGGIRHKTEMTRWDVIFFWRSIVWLFLQCYFGTSDPDAVLLACLTLTRQKFTYSDFFKYVQQKLESKANLWKSDMYTIKICLFAFRCPKTNSTYLLILLLMFLNKVMFYWNKKSGRL